MSRLLIVEDQPNDLRNAAEVARSLGFTSVEARASSMAARVLLDAGLLGDLFKVNAYVSKMDDISQLRNVLSGFAAAAS
jgi:hypothetical protein